MYSGTASQTASSRWGDYSAMSVDPVDDCTFWYTQMHISAGNARLTRIGTLRFATCAAAVAPTVSIDIAGESPTWSTADPTVGTVTASAGGALTISSLACTGGVRGPVSGLGTAQRVPFQFVLTDLAGQRIPSPLVNPIRVRVVLMPTKLGPVVSAAPCARRPGTYALSCSLPLVPEPMPKPYPAGG